MQRDAIIRCGCLVFVHIATVKFKFLFVCIRLLLLRFFVRFHPPPLLVGSGEPEIQPSLAYLTINDGWFEENHAPDCVA